VFVREVQVAQIPASAIENALDLRLAYGKKIIDPKYQQGRPTRSQSPMGVAARATHVAPVAGGDQAELVEAAVATHPGGQACPGKVWKVTPG
jgi:hypothetical protein